MKDLIMEKLLQYEQNTSPEQKKLDQLKIEGQCPLTEYSVDAEQFIINTLNMNKEQQDKIWNELSDEQRAEYSKEFQQETENYSTSIKHCDIENDFEYRTGYSNGVATTLEELFGSHNLNPKPLTYEDILEWSKGIDLGRLNKKLEAIGDLLLVAKYLNKGWKPDWKNDTEPKWYLCDIPGKKPIPCFTVQNNSCIVYFRTEELALQAIIILGEETIKLALSTDY